MGRNIIDTVSLVPNIYKKDFDSLATDFLKKYYPQALKNPVPVPIKEIAEKRMGLKVITKYSLSDDFSILGQICCTSGLAAIYDADKKKYKDLKVRRGTMFIDPDVITLRNEGCFNNTIAHECVHWWIHRNYCVLAKANDPLKRRAYSCPVEVKDENFKKLWNDKDWMEWQANGIAARILMPFETTKNKIRELFKRSKMNSEKTETAYYIQEIVSELAEFYGVSKQAVKIRMREIGFVQVDGVYNYVNGRYISPFSFNTSSIIKNQSFNIEATDLFKAYYLNKEFRKIIDSGKLCYIDGHVCINNEKYVYNSEERNCLTPYALSHLDECCFVFDRGYIYASKYSENKDYNRIMQRNSINKSTEEYSFELNSHNLTLLNQIRNAKTHSRLIRLYPGSFAETLKKMQAERKLSIKMLANKSLVGEKTIQRLRSDENYSTTIQTILGLCVGLKLSLPEAEMLIDKTDLKLNSMKIDGYVYRCVLGACAVNDIYEINEMLKSCGVAELGSSSID